MDFLGLSTQYKCTGPCSTPDSPEPVIKAVFMLLLSALPEAGPDSGESPVSLSAALPGDTDPNHSALERKISYKDTHPVGYCWPCVV